ncbi:hypothetical protein IAR55_005942 [Kwoniella newhampshirensis]|uniref:Major facilitator superfamily (MFS) profile domain-containing protein n=1 Tax=Kwoniella newhampshirensis TaxID=1651941 RepID=A0AAW0YK54_9TREE
MSGLGQPMNHERNDNAQCSKAGVPAVVTTPTESRIDDDAATAAAAPKWVDSETTLCQKGMSNSTSLDPALKTDCERQPSRMNLGNLKGSALTTSQHSQSDDTSDRVTNDISDIVATPNDSTPSNPPPASEMEKSIGTPPGQPHFLDNKSALFKLIFITTACATQLLAQAQFGMLVFPLHDVGASLGTQDPGEMSWIAASYGLTVGMFLVMSGRLGDLYGPKLFWKIGLVVIVFANIGSGFCKSPIPFDICRALTGLGSAFALPNALAILGRTFPPGKTRNRAFATLGALAPAGFWVGGAIASIFAQLVSVRWIWWFIAIFTFVFLLIGLYVLPPDTPHPDPLSRRFDYIGAILLALSLGFFNFSWNQAALAGWSDPVVYVILIASLLCFPAFFFWERRVGKAALIPVEVLTKQSLLVYLTLWLGWMSLGVLILYTTFFLYNIRGYHRPLTVTAQIFPLVPAGIVAALSVPWLLHNLPGHLIFLIAMLFFMICNLLGATAPTHGIYWGNTMFSLITGAIGPDLSFSTGQLIVSNAVDHEFQGIAAGMVSMITNYSMSIGLGMAGTVERYVKGDGTSTHDVLKGYRAAFYFATGLGALATVIVALFVRMPKQLHHGSGHGEEKDQEDPRGELVGGQV